MKKFLIIILAMALFPAGYAKEGKMKKVYLVYGSFMGSTKETAEYMKKTLDKAGCKAEISAASQASGDLSGYDLVILGSAIHGAAPHPDIIAYVQKNREALGKVPVAVFIMCATITSSNQGTREKAGHYPEMVAVGFTPVSTAVFGGMIGEPKSGFERFMAKLFMGIEKFGDFRDWEKIKEWTLSLI